MAANLFNDLFGNGPVETGTVAGVEKYLSEEHGAVKGATAKGTFVATIDAIAEDKDDPTRLELAVGGAACLAHIGGFCQVQNWNAGEAPNIGDQEFDDADYTDAILKQAIADAIALIASTKVNWWKCNHHTGGDVASGYVARYLRLIAINKIDADATTIVWRAGHWFDTRGWLTALGVPGINGGDGAALAARIKVDDAIAKRIRSGPAGTAAFEAVFAGLTAVATHPVVGYAASPQLPEYEAWKAAHNALVANPAKYHIGAVYLTGQRREILPVMPDPVISFVATAIRFYNRDATLLRAAVFANVSDDNTALAAFRAAGTFVSSEREHVGIAAWVANDPAARQGAAAQ